MQLITQPCVVCHKTSEIEVEATKYADYMDGLLVQEVWPDKDAGWREMMITGTHPACWDKMMEDDEA